METKWVWHGHHEAAFPFEVLKESYESRLNTIMTVKAKGETPGQIERRLQLFKKVQNPPVWLLEAWAEADKATTELNKARAELNKARAEYYKARAEYRKAYAEVDKAYAEVDKARVEYRKAWAELDKAIQQNLPEMMELHKTECGCGWTSENRNIFEYSEVADGK